MSSDADLKRSIGFWAGVAIVIGSVIGSGVFRTPASIAKVLQDPPLTIALWVGTGVLTLCGALTLAELGTLLPKTGGTYVYLRAAYGDAAAFVFGWLYVMAAIPAGMAALATFFGELSLRLSGRDPATAPAYAVPAIACAMIVVLSLVNIRGASLGAAVQSSFTVIKTAALLAVILVGVWLVGGSVDNLRSAPTPLAERGGLVGLAAAVASVFFTYNGWVYIGLVAGEIKRPEKRLAPMLLVGTLTITALYVGANLVYGYVYPVTALPGRLPAQDLMAKAFGPVGGTVIAGGIVASVFGAMNGMILTNSRVAYALARDGLMFSFLGHCHPRYFTPDKSIATQGVMALVLTVWLREFDKLTSYFEVVECSALIFMVAAVFPLRRRMADAPRPYRVPLYPFVPLVAVIGTAVGLCAIVWSSIARDNNYAPVLGLLIAALGFPIYAVWKRSTSLAQKASENS